MVDKGNELFHLQITELQSSRGIADYLRGLSQSPAGFLLTFRGNHLGK